MSDSIGYRLLCARNRKGLSKYDVGGMINYSPETITQWEHDKKVPSLQNVIKLSEIYDVTIDWIAKGKNT